MTAPFVGRRAELAQLVTCVDALERGQGSLCVLIGEPGIGKTRLAEELAHLAEARGARAVWGSAWDGGGAPAYWPWIQIVRDLRSDLPEPDDRLRNDLGPLWDAGTGEVEAATDVELLRFRRFDALRAVLQLAGAHRPLVAILDDMHAADRATLHALEAVARLLRNLRVMLIVTHREAEARLDPELGNQLARIARHGTALRLSHLSRNDADKMLAGLDVLPQRVVDQIYQLTGGNPLFLGETIRLVRTGARPHEVPDGVRAIIRERLARLDDAARAVIEAAAVIGREMDQGALERTSGIGPAAFARSLRDLRLAGALEDRGDRVQFVHALFRESVYGDLDVTRRGELHLRCAHHLADDPLAIEPLARHALAALPAGDAAAALEWAVRAGEAAARSLAFDRAVDMFDGAIRAARQLPPDAGRDIDLELRLAEALAQLGQDERASALCVRAADRARDMGDGARMARAALTLGAKLRIGFVDTQLIRLLEEALAMLGDSEPALRSRAMARLAAAQQPAPEPEPPMQTARAAVALARTTGDADVLMQTLFAAGAALADYAHPDERLELARELVELALARRQLVVAQQGYARMAIDLLELSDVTGADAAIAAHARLGAALGHPRWQWRGHLMLAMRAMMEGRFEDAEAERAEARRLIALAEDRNGETTLAVQRLGSVRARPTGTLAELDGDDLENLLALDYMSDIVAAIRACLAARAGNVEPARRILPRLASLSQYASSSDPLFLSLLADIAAIVGDPGQAEAILHRLDRHADRVWTWGVFGMMWEGPASQHRGALLQVVGREAEAVACFHDALAVAEAVSAEPLAARMRSRLAGSSAPQPPRAVAPAPELTLSREGDVWTVRSGTGRVQLKHSRALDMLDQLVRNPGREFHVFDLAAPAPGEPGAAIDLGDAGPALDDMAKQSYRNRLRELDEELAQAEAWADNGRCERLRAEREFLAEQLAGAVGLGGRDRRSALAVERARVNVQKRLRGVVKKIGETLPDLAHQLENDLKTGTYVSYRRESRS